MNLLKRFHFALGVCIALAAAVAAWGQTPAANVVYVATGNNQVYAVPVNGATPTAVISTKGAAYTSLAVGPDNTSDNNTTNADFFLYACDTGNGTIVRLTMSTADPSNAASATTTVENTIGQPVCGRAGSNGNFYFASGSDVYEIEDASSTADDGSPTVSSTVITSNASSLGSITQKNIGDMLVVGSSGIILRAAYLGDTSSFPFTTTLSSYITDTNDLTDPVGVARAQAPEQSDPKQQVINDIFVANGGGNNAMYGFDPSSSRTAPFCSYSSFSATPTSIAASEDNYLYVALNSNHWHDWGVQILKPDCQSVSSISLSVLKSGGFSTTGPMAVAVPPVEELPVLSLTDTTSGATNFNFGSSLLQVTPGGCALTDIKQTPMPLSFLQGLVNNAKVSPDLQGEGASWYGGAPAPGNGERGFGTVYTVKTTDPNCQFETTSTGGTNLLISGFFNPTVVNPRIIHCADDFKGGCQVISATGNWPTGGYLPGDISIGGNIIAPGSKYFLVNGNLLSQTEQGYFCGFESPLTDVSYDEATGLFSGTLASFNAGQGLSVKFKLGADGSCSSGNFVTNAYALLSVAQVQDLNGNADFAPVLQVDTQGNSTDTPPIFKFNSNSQNYQFSLNLTGYAPGIYELSVTFLTNNAPIAVTYFEVQ